MSHTLGMLCARVVFGGTHLPDVRKGTRAEQILSMSLASKQIEAHLTGDLLPSFKVATST
jgi:hypothetical protein